MIWWKYLGCTALDNCFNDMQFDLCFTETLPASAGLALNKYQWLYLGSYQLLQIDQVAVVGIYNEVDSAWPKKGGKNEPCQWLSLLFLIDSCSRYITIWISLFQIYSARLVYHLLSFVCKWYSDSKEKELMLISWDHPTFGRQVDLDLLMYFVGIAQSV